MESAPPVTAESAPQRAMALLASGVPLSLLLDLAFGPRSEDLLMQEPRPTLPSPRPA